MSSRNGSTVAFLASFTLFFSFSVGATRCRAQSETDGSQANAPSFKSIAIKTDNSGIRSHAINLGPGQLTVTNVTLGVLIQNAYKLEDNQISAAPPWLNTQPYDIVASLDRPPSEEAPTNELRALLSDCFKLAVHRETRLVPVYALRVAEGGAKFVEPVTTRCLRSQSHPRGEGQDCRSRGSRFNSRKNTVRGTGSSSSRRNWPARPL